jgi:hypothetical protein
MRVKNGIVHALPPERSARFAQFMKDYERIREAEGRGSEGEDFYLNLPYEDISGRNSKQWRIRARRKRLDELSLGSCGISSHCR